MADPRTAGCTAVQRCGSAINLKVHFHTLVPDGVFDLTERGPARFVPLKVPSDEEVARILTVVIRKVARAGLLEAGDDRSAVRPPFALHRLSAGLDGRLVYRMKRPRGGSLFLVLTPDELLSRIATLVPPPRTHALQYHGVFAPNSRHRARVAPAGAGGAGGHGGMAASHVQGDHAATVDRAPGAAARPEPTGAFRLSAPADPPTPERPAPRTRVPWAELLRKVFAFDVLECPRCAGRLEVIAFIAEPGVARRILGHLGLDAQGPPLAKASAPNHDLAAGDEGPD